jgi:hypothetical protein
MPQDWIILRSVGSVDTVHGWCSPKMWRNMSVLLIMIVTAGS